MLVLASYVVIPSIEWDEEEQELKLTSDFAADARAKVRINALMKARDTSALTPMTLVAYEGKLGWLPEKFDKAQLVDVSKQEVEVLGSDEAHRESRVLMCGSNPRPRAP